MLGQPDFGYGDWPREGEIDIMEWVNQIGKSHNVFDDKFN